MFNLIRTDIKRMFRQKSIYITMAVFWAVILLGLVMIKVVTTPELYEAAVNSGMEITTGDIEMTQTLNNTSLSSFFATDIIGGGAFALCMSIMTAIFISGDFKGGFIKNILSVTPVRSHYIFSKLAVVAVTAAVTEAATVIFAWIGVWACGLTLTFGNPGHLLIILAISWFIAVAFGMQIVFLYILTKSEGLSVAAAIVLPAGLIVQIIDGVLSVLHIQIMPFTLAGQGKLAAQLGERMDYFSAAKGAGIILLWLAFYTISAAVVLRRKDI